MHHLEAPRSACRRSHEKTRPLASDRLSDSSDRPSDSSAVFMKSVQFLRRRVTQGTVTTTRGERRKCFSSSDRPINCRVAGRPSASIDRRSTEWPSATSPGCAGSLAYAAAGRTLRPASCLAGHRYIRTPVENSHVSSNQPDLTTTKLGEVSHRMKCNGDQGADLHPIRRA